MFRVCFIDPYQGTALADYCYNKLGKRKAAFMTEWPPPTRWACTSSSRTASPSWRQGDVRQRLQPRRPGVPGPVGHDQELQGYVLVCCSDNYKDGGLVAKQARDLGLNLQIIGGDSWMIADILTLAGKQLEGAFFTCIADVTTPRFSPSTRLSTRSTASIRKSMATWALTASIIENAIKEVTANGAPMDQAKLRDAIENTKNLPVFTASKFTFDKAATTRTTKPSC